MTAVRSESSDLILFYLRVSKDKTGDELGVERQLKDGKAVAKRIGARRTIEFRDNDTGGGEEADREHFEEMIDFIVSGQADGATIYGMTWNRLSRNGMDTERLLALCTLHDIRIICPKEGIDRRPASEGALMERIYSAFGIEEKRQIIMRVNAKLADKRARGERCGKVPFGWAADNTAHPVQGEMIKGAVGRFLAGGSLSSIATEWNECRLPRINGREWDGAAVRRIIERPRNAGIYTHKGERLNVAAQWDALITEDEHLAVCARTAARKREDLQRTLLGGVPVCGRCTDASRHLYGYQSRQRGVCYPQYSCNSKGGCGAQVRQHRLDEYVIHAAVTRLTQLKAADLVSRDKATRLAELRTRIDALEARRLEAAELFGAGVIDGKQLAKITADTAADLAASQRERDSLLSETGRAKVLAQLIGPGAAEAWKRASDTIKRAAIGELMTITLNEGNAWHTPMRERVTLTPLV